LKIRFSHAASQRRASQSALARLEKSATDTRLSTVERFATALGFQVEYRLVPTPDHRPATR